VSSPQQSSASTVSRPSVLLLEDYDALAVAIRSLLKRFAPRHVTTVAHSVADAETAASKSSPDLFIIDFDPSCSGLTAFLQKMRKDHPAAQALVLAVDVPREIAAQRTEFGALQFIQKPYEVAEFGATVEALLGPRSTTESPGTLRALSLPDIVALQCAGRRSAIVDVRGSRGDSGSVHILDGQIFHAETEEASGVKALEEMFNWSSPRIEETTKRSNAQRTIHGPWTSIFLAACRRAQSLKMAPVVESRPKTGKKIVIIDDTETLVLFAEDALSTADPESRITTALTGTGGLEQIERALPDLVLLDYSLPDINGDEICRRLLQDEQTARIPILMMSGHVAEMTATAARFENIVATIEKPFLSGALVDLVERTLAAGPRPVVQSKAISTPKPKPKEEQPAVVEAAPPPLPFSAPKRSIESVEPARALPNVPTVSAPVPLTGKNEVVLGLFLEVMSMQLTPQLRMGAIRAKPVSLTVSVHFPSNGTQIPTETGFQLASTQLDEKGQISAVRLVPTAKPFQPAQMRNAFEIGGVAMIPNETRTRVQLTPAGTTPMTMELLAHLEMGGVELSPTFQLAQLTLKWRTSVVHVTLNPKAPEQSGASFDVAEVELDGSGKIAELLLNPIK